MYFRIIGIKETQNKKYNMDILIQWESESEIRWLLEDYWIVLLNISTYENSTQSFWALKLNIKYKNQKIEIISYLTDINIAVHTFLIIWFDISSINFTDSNKLSDTKAQEILLNSKIKTKEEVKNQSQTVAQKKENEKKIYKDKNLEKILKIAEDTFGQIEFLLQKVWDKVSQDKIRDLKVMKQELTKLKMSKNDDKISDLLEKIYDKSNAIEIEYLDYMQKHKYYPIPNSIVSNIDIVMENQKYKKAKKIKEIWATRDSDDNYYLCFEKTGIYIRLLFKDIYNNIKNFKVFINNIFDYLQLIIIILLVSTAIILWTKKIYYSLDENLYYYSFLIQTSMFWLVIYYIQKFKTQKIYQNIILLVVAIFCSSVLFWLLKSNFSF